MQLGPKRTARLRCSRQGLASFLVTVHGATGDWSIFRPIGVISACQFVRKHGPVLRRPTNTPLSPGGRGAGGEGATPRNHEVIVGRPLRLCGVPGRLAMSVAHDVAFPLSEQGRHAERTISKLNDWPACALVNASPIMLLRPAHDSGPGRFASPFPYGSFIRDSMPVLTGAFSDPFAPSLSLPHCRIHRNRPRRVRLAESSFVINLCCRRSISRSGNRTVPALGIGKSQPTGAKPPRVCCTRH